MTKRPMPLEEIILRARLERGWTRQELAKRAGVSPAMITNWESGKIGGPKNLTNVRAVADALDLDPNVLFAAIADRVVAEQRARRSSSP
jgi:transcriptional regulator with XRE-family HTH domain